MTHRILDRAIAEFASPDTWTMRSRLSFPAVTATSRLLLALAPRIAMKHPRLDTRLWRLLARAPTMCFVLSLDFHRASITVLADVARICVHLRTLTISGGPRISFAAAESIAKIASLTAVELRINFYSAVRAETDADETTRALGALAALPHLTRVQVPFLCKGVSLAPLLLSRAADRQPEEGAESATSAIKTQRQQAPSTTLTSLSVARSWLLPDSDLASIARVVTLRELDVSGNARLESALTAASLASMLASLPLLVTLTVDRHAAFSDEHLAVLGDACPHLTKLSAADTSITDDGIARLVDGLARPLVACLSVSACKSITRIGDIVMFSESLEDLNMSKTVGRNASVGWRGALSQQRGAPAVAAPAATAAPVLAGIERCTRLRKFTLNCDLMSLRAVDMEPLGRLRSPLEYFSAESSSAPGESFATYLAGFSATLTTLRLPQPPLEALRLLRGFTGLTTLAITTPGPDDLCLQHICEHMPNLTQLRTLGSSISDAAAHRWLPMLSQLRVLALRQTTALTDDGIRCIASLQHLVVLDVARAALLTNAMVEFLHAGAFPRLRTLMKFGCLRVTTAMDLIDGRWFDKSSDFEASCEVESDADEGEVPPHRAE